MITSLNRQIIYRPRDLVGEVPPWLKKKFIFLGNDIGLKSKFDWIYAKRKTKLRHTRYRVPWKVPLDLLKIWQKGYDFQFAGSTNKFSSRPLMRPILQDNSGFFTNIAAFWLFLRFETVFWFSDGVFFPSEGKKKPKKKNRSHYTVPLLWIDRKNYRYTHRNKKGYST